MLDDAARRNRDDVQETRDVLFPRSTWAGIEAGTITVAFRRWRRPSAKAGARHRTAAGVVAIHSVQRIDLDQITENDAHLAGSRPARRCWRTWPLGSDGDLYPATPAAELAGASGREVPRFKADVRRLKELGLTESLVRGYRLSPRGRLVLAQLPASAPRDPPAFIGT